LRLNTASAIGERHILPRQTNKTLIISKNYSPVFVLLKGIAVGT
jgi:hypothetical protein